MTVTAMLVGGQSPPLVQVVVDDAPDGEAWTLTGSAAGTTWTVPGGVGIGEGDQVSRTDNLAPGNVPVVYTFTSTSVIESSTPVIVPFGKRAVLQTLDGQRTLQVDLRMGSDAINLPTSIASFRIPGRSRPVHRYDVLGDVVSELRILVPLSQTKQFRELLASGAPIVYRFGEPVVDLDLVGVIALSRVSSTEVLYARQERAWDLQYEISDHPLQDVPVGAFSWDVFDAAFAGAEWDDGFDQTFATLTWDQFDTFDLSTL